MVVVTSQAPNQLNSDKNNKVMNKRGAPNEKWVRIVGCALCSITIHTCPLLVGSDKIPSAAIILTGPDLNSYDLQYIVITIAITLMVAFGSVNENCFMTVPSHVSYVIMLNSSSI